MINWKKIIVWLLIFVIIIDIIDYFILGFGTYLRAIILFIFFITYLLITKKIIIDRVYSSFLIFFIYILFISIINSSNYFITFSGLLSILLSTTFYFFSYNVFKSNYLNDLLYLKVWLFVIPILFIINLLIYNIFKIGEPIYGGLNTLRFGDLHHSRIYSGSLTLILSFVLFKYSKPKILLIILLFILFIILLLSLRRTAIILVIQSFIIYLFFYKKKNKYFYLYIFSFILIIWFFYPLYQEKLIEIFEVRSDRIILSNETIEEESRFQESLVVTKKIFSFEDLQYSLIGTEFLNSFGTYSFFEFDPPNTRILHTDYAVILHGSGLLGLILYSLFLFEIIRSIYLRIKLTGLKDDISILELMILFVLIVVTFSGSILNVTFRTMFFIILGICFRNNDNLFQKKYLKY